MEHSPRFCLSLHAGYGCRHSGACCTAGWTIPIEADAYERVRLHIGEANTALRFTRRGPLPEGAAAIVGTRVDGACAFFESDRGRLCAIHRELGPDALPSACRQFPRTVVHDSAGMRISFSHFCPSAAALLLTSARPTIVSAPPNVDLGGALDGLDARDALPPLLQPEMLMDVADYVAWESHAIEVLGRDDLTAVEAIEVIAAATRDLERWRPGPITLGDAVVRAYASACGPSEAPPSPRLRRDLAEARRAEVGTECSPAQRDRRASASGGGAPRALINADVDEHAENLRRIELAYASVPEGLRPEAGGQKSGETWPPIPALWSLPAVDRVVRHYLAARLFGNWIAYYGRGLEAIIEYLRICLAVLKMEAARHSTCSPVSASWQTVIEPAVRKSDLLLVHLMDAKDLARRLPPNPR